MDLQEKQKWSLERKIFHFLEVLELYYSNLEGKVYIAFSGGKDSTVLVFLADVFCKTHGLPPIPLVFNNTTNEHKQILEFVKSFGDRVTWLRPKITFAQSLEKNGFPLVSKEQAQRISEAKNTKSDYLRNLRLDGVERTSKSSDKKYVSGKISEKWKYLVYEDIEVTSKCCDILKKQPVAKFEKESGLSPIIGVLAEESNLRKQQYNKNGCIEYGKRNKCKPLSIFTEEDIWQIIKNHNIKICDVYYDQEIDGEIVKGEDRTGCAYCAFGVNFEDPENTKFHRLQKREPNRFNSFMDKLGYRKALRLQGVFINDPLVVGDTVITKSGKAIVVEILNDTVTLMKDDISYKEPFEKVSKYPRT